MAKILDTPEENRWFVQGYRETTLNSIDGTEHVTRGFGFINYSCYIFDEQFHILSRNI